MDGRKPLYYIAIVSLSNLLKVTYELLQAKRTLLASSEWNKWLKLISKINPRNGRRFYFMALAVTNTQCQLLDDLVVLLQP